MDDEVFLLRVCRINLQPVILGHYNILVRVQEIVRARSPMVGLYKRNAAQRGVRRQRSDLGWEGDIS